MVSNNNVPTYKNYYNIDRLNQKIHRFSGVADTWT